MRMNQRAMNFYQKAFGWTFEKYGNQEYWLAKTGEKDEPGIDGAIQPRRTKGTTVVNTITVKDIDESIKKIEKNGGKVVVPKMEIPTMGTLAYFVDSEGNMQGIMQPVPPPKK
jgi:predicted enzyme related to lactoylglutathione lyase